MRHSQRQFVVVNQGIRIADARSGSGRRMRMRSGQKDGDRRQAIQLTDSTRPAGRVLEQGVPPFTRMKLAIEASFIGFTLPAHKATGEWMIREVWLGLPDLKHLGSAHRTNALRCRTAVLHGYLSRVVHLPLCLALHAECFHRFAAPVWLSDFRGCPKLPAAPPLD